MTRRRSRRRSISGPSRTSWIATPAAAPDFSWPEMRVAVETDGYRTHRTRRAFEDDRRRDERLTLAGWRVIRISWRQLVERPTEVVLLLRGLLRG